MKHKLTKVEIQNQLLNILQYFDQYCKQEHLKYNLAGGTLLGAVRHKGFIPWDDDIDVCMPRPDYDKLIRTFDEISDKRFQLSSYDAGNSYRPYAKILDMNTSVIAKTSEDEQHLWIDIIPVDGLPNEKNKIRKIYQNVSWYRNILNLTRCRLGTGKTPLRRFSKYILQPIARLYGEKRLLNKIENIAHEYAYSTSNNVGAITWGIYGERECMSKFKFEKQILVEFCGYKFPTFSCWNEYLSNLYGDYMQLPPVEKRKTHEMEAYVIKN